MEKKNLFIMCGLSFSGKTTFAEKLSEKINADIISLDDINMERGLGFGGDGISDTEWGNSFVMSVEKMRELMSSDKNIIYDDTTCFRWMRDKLVETADEFGYHSKIVFMNISADVIQKRIQGNIISQGRHSIKKEIFEDLRSKFEFPQKDEDFIYIDETNSIEEVWKSLE
jgi:predicted kinase